MKSGGKGISRQFWTYRTIQTYRICRSVFRKIWPRNPLPNRDTKNYSFISRSAENVDELPRVVRSQLQMQTSNTSRMDPIPVFIYVYTFLMIFFRSFLCETKYGKPKETKAWHTHSDRPTGRTTESTRQRNGSQRSQNHRKQVPTETDASTLKRTYYSGLVTKSLERRPQNSTIDTAKRRQSLR